MPEQLGPEHEEGRVGGHRGGARPRAGGGSPVRGPPRSRRSWAPSPWRDPRSGPGPGRPLFGSRGRPPAGSAGSGAAAAPSADSCVPRGRRAPSRRGGTSGSRSPVAAHREARSRRWRAAPAPARRSAVPVAARPVDVQPGHRRALLDLGRAPARCAATWSREDAQRARDNRAVPSGCAQAPRPVTRRRIRSISAGQARVAAPGRRAAAASSAIRGRPLMHGPHWAADSSAR